MICSNVCPSNFFFFKILLDVSLQCKSESSSVMSDSATLWIMQSVEFSRSEYWSGSLSFLQGIFPAQGSNPGLPHCRWVLYQLSHKGNPYIFCNVILYKFWNFHTHKKAEVLFGIELKFWINLKRTNIFIVLSFLIYKHGLTIHMWCLLSFCLSNLWRKHLNI